MRQRKMQRASAPAQCAVQLAATRGTAAARGLKSHFAGKKTAWVRRRFFIPRTAAVTMVAPSVG